MGQSRVLKPAIGFEGIGEEIGENGCRCKAIKAIVVKKYLHLPHMVLGCC